MRKLTTLAFIVGVGLAGTLSANAMTPASLGQAAPGMTVVVAGGCGPGFHRGPLGGCRPNAAGPVVVVPGAVIVAPGPCGGRGTHRVCGPRGCARVCN